MITLAEELGRGHRTAQGTGVAVDQVLGDEGLEAGEVVEQEDVTGLDLALLMVELDIDLEQLFQHGQGTPGPLVHAGADLQIPFLDHMHKPLGPHRASLGGAPPLQSMDPTAPLHRPVRPGTGAPPAQPSAGASKVRNASGSRVGLPTALTTACSVAPVTSTSSGSRRRV